MGAFATLSFPFLTAVALCLLGFWCCDRALGQRSEWQSGSPTRLLAVRAVLLAVSGAGALWFRWSDLPSGDSLRAVTLVLGGVLTWKAATEDIDVATDNPLWGARVQALASFAGLTVTPLFLAVWLPLMAHPFSAWKHHGTLPLRLLQLVLAFTLAAVALPLAGQSPPPVAALLFIALVMLASHYVITAFAKARLGPHWYSWMLENKLHHVVASARTWGWGRFVSDAHFGQLLRVVRRVEVPLQIATFALEASVPLLLLHPTLAVGLAITLCGFHLVVFVTTGILFWEWMLTNAALAWLVSSLPAEALRPAFGLTATALGMALMLLPLKGYLWKLMPLGWWDTPLTQRVQWRVITPSGRTYGLYNDFMCPHERLYGRCHGCFLIPNRVFTYHLGEVWRRELRDGIRALKHSPERISQLRAQFGIDVSDHTKTRQHVTYLRTFFQRLNAGARKAVLPRPLRWLKAPGGQYFYWGELEAYRRQEPVVRVQAWYLEEYFDGEDYAKLSETLLMETEVSSRPEAAIHELDEHVVDGHLMARAAGKLLDAPDWVLDRAKSASPPPAGAAPAGAPPVQSGA